MATKPLTTEAIAQTEKKMEMSLDDIIKMSKKNVAKGKRPLRTSNKNQGFRNGGRSQVNSYKVQNFLDSRSSIRQGVLARRRSNIPGTQFPLTTEVARRAVNAPIRNRGISSYKPRAAPVQRKNHDGKSAEQVSGVHTGGHPIAGYLLSKVISRQRQTLDARFADMKERRRVMSQQTVRGGFNVNTSRHHGPRQQPPQRQVRVGVAPSGSGRRFGNFAKY